MDITPSNNAQKLFDLLFRAKRQFELTPELLINLDVCSMYHSLINIDNNAKLKAWQKAMASGSFRYGRRCNIDDIGYGNIFGDIEHLIGYMEHEDIAAAFHDFKTISKVDMRVVSYGSDLYGRAINSDDCEPVIFRNLHLRHAFSKLACAKDVNTFKYHLDDLISNRGQLPESIRTYIDYASTLTDNEKQALIINNLGYVCNNQDDGKPIDSLTDDYAYSYDIIHECMDRCVDEQDYRIISPFGMAIPNPDKQHDGDGIAPMVAVRSIAINKEKAFLYISPDQRIDIAKRAYWFEERKDRARCEAVIAAAMYLADRNHTLLPVDHYTDENYVDTVHHLYKLQKAKHPYDIVLLKQADGFYETFGEDAVRCASASRPLWLRGIGNNILANAIALTETDVHTLKADGHRLFIVDYIKEPNLHHVCWLPNHLNVIFSYPHAKIDTHLVTEDGETFSVSGTFNDKKLPEKAFDNTMNGYYCSLTTAYERSFAAKALLVYYNQKEISDIIAKGSNTILPED